jgi:hypothetical protein
MSLRTAGVISHHEARNNLAPGRHIHVLLLRNSDVKGSGVDAGDKESE